MSDLPDHSNASEASTGNENTVKRRAPPRSSRRIAIKETVEDELPVKVPQKQEKKPEKKLAKPKPDPNRETVITEHGHTIHPNGTPLPPPFHTFG